MICRGMENVALSTAAFTNTRETENATYHFEGHHGKVDSKEMSHNLESVFGVRVQFGGNIGIPLFGGAKWEMEMSSSVTTSKTETTSHVSSIIFFPSSPPPLIPRYAESCH